MVVWCPRRLLARRVFIDSNIPMYVAGAEHPNKGPALRFMERVRAGEVEACTSTEVLQEILYRYHAMGRVDLATTVYNLFVALVPEVLPVTLADTDLARDLLASMAGVSARDAVHAASCSTTTWTVWRPSIGASAGWVG